MRDGNAERQQMWGERMNSTAFEEKIELANGLDVEANKRNPSIAI